MPSEEFLKWMREQYGSEAEAGRADLPRGLSGDPLDREAVIPIFETRVLIQTEAGVQVVEIRPVDPPGPSSWEKRLVRGVVALVGEVTTTPARARAWVEALQVADPDDEGAA